MGVRRYLISTRIRDGDPSERFHQAHAYQYATAPYTRTGFTVKENLASRSGVDQRDILPYNRCAVTLSRDRREIHGYTWSDDILQLVAGGPASSISRFRTRARAPRTPIDRRDYMRSCSQTRRFGGSDTTVRTISRWQRPRRHGHEDTFTPVAGPLRGIVARHSRQTQRYVDLFFSIGIRCCYGFAEWRVEWCVVDLTRCDLVSTACRWFRRVVLRYNCNPGNESISPQIQRDENSCFASRFLKCLKRRGYYKMYLRHAFSVTNCCCPIKIYYVTVMIYAKKKGRLCAAKLCITLHK